MLDSDAVEAAVINTSRRTSLIDGYFQVVGVAAVQGGLVLYSQGHLGSTLLYCSPGCQWPLVGVTGDSIILKGTILNQFGVQPSVGSVVDVFKKSPDQVLAHRYAGFVEVNTHVDLGLRAGK